MSQAASALKAAKMYGVEVSPDLISRVTHAVVDELAEWQARPLDRAA